MPRHRDPERREAEIRDIVLDLVAREGYDNVTMDAIALAARASKTTLYRRWPSKAAIVVDALRDRGGLLIEVPDTGSLRGDLLETVGGVARALTREAELAIALLAAARRDDELFETIQRHMGDPRREVGRVAVDRAVRRGELPEDTDRSMVDELAMPLLLHRALWKDGELDDAFVRHIVDDLLLPLLTAGAGAGRREIAY
jgi:AcrR family transcriptional regulator